MKLTILQLAPSPWYYPLPRLKYSPQHFVLKHAESKTKFHNHTRWRVIVRYRNLVTNFNGTD